MISRAAARARSPGGIAISGAAHGYVRKALTLAYTDLGEQVVKNIDEPVRAFRVAVSNLTDHDEDRATSSAKPPDRPTVAVLPFDMFGGSSEADGLADGIAEDIITELSRISGLAVIARNYTFTYKGRAVDVKHRSSGLTWRRAGPSRLIPWDPPSCCGS